MNTMRILMFHNRYLSRGGEDESTDMEVELLRSYGHEVDLVEMHNRSLAEQNLLRVGMETVWSARVYRLVQQELGKKSYDLVHVQNFFPQFSPSIHHAAKAAGVTVVQSLRNYRLLCLNGLFYRDGRICEDCMGRSLPWPGVVHKCYRNSFPGSAVVASMLVSHRLLKTWHTRVDLFLALSEFARDKLIEGGLPADKIVVKPNFVHPDPGAGGGDRSYVLLVSRLVEEKGIPAVLKAWKKLDASIPLKIVGDGPLAQYVRNAVEGIPWVEVLGKRSLSEVYDLMGQSRFALFPTELYETFGRVIIEAYAKGTPVIASDLGAGGRLVNEGKTGLHFRPGDVDDLSQKVRWAWEHPKEMAAMGRNARREYEEKYTAEKNYKILMSIYERAIAHHKENRG